MSLSLYREDPGERIDAQQVRRTLVMFRDEPTRGRAVVAELGRAVIGYALLVSFWSNEYGGEICVIDELYVAPANRSQGIATKLISSIEPDRSLWPRCPVAIALEVTPGNSQARALYERLGFRSKNQTLRRREQSSGSNPNP